MRNINIKRANRKELKNKGKSRKKNEKSEGKVVNSIKRQKWFIK
jgi:hypothetical protein